MSHRFCATQQIFVYPTFALSSSCELLTFPFDIPDLYRLLISSRWHTYLIVPVFEISCLWILYRYVIKFVFFLLLVCHMLVWFLKHLEEPRGIEENSSSPTPPKCQMQSCPLYKPWVKCHHPVKSSLIPYLVCNSKLGLIKSRCPLTVCCLTGQKLLGTRCPLSPLNL